MNIIEKTAHQLSCSFEDAAYHLGFTIEEIQKMKEETSTSKTYWIVIFGSRKLSVGEAGYKVFKTEEEADEYFQSMEYYSNNKYVSDQENSILIEVEIPM